MDAAKETDPLEELARLLARVRTLAPVPARFSALSDEQLEALPRLYRFAASELARLQASGADPAREARAHELFERAHGLLGSCLAPRRGSPAARFGAFLGARVPRAIRREWRLVCLILVTIYGLAGLSFVAVARDPDLAPSLLSREIVEQEIEQLEATRDGEPFRGNFTFGLRESPSTAGVLMLHNLGVSMLFFAAALVPPLYVILLGTNALMLGTYTAVAHHYGQAGSISSILWCHGVLEIQAIVLAGAAGLVLLRGWVRPGAYSRRHALERESRRALELLAAVVPMLVAAGSIEAFVSPHVGTAARTATAVASGVALLAWVLLGGRGRSERRPAPHM